MGNDPRSMPDAYENEEPGAWKRRRQLPGLAVRHTDHRLLSEQGEPKLAGAIRGSYLPDGQ
jgi:hypothetical protein